MKNQYVRGDWLKKRGGGLGQFADLRRGLARKRGVVVLREVNTPMPTMSKLQHYTTKFHDCCLGNISRGR